LSAWVAGARSGSNVRSQTSKLGVGTEEEGG